MALNIDNKFIRKIRVNDNSADPKIVDRNITKLYISSDPEGTYRWAEAYDIIPLPNSVSGIDLSTVKVSPFFMDENDAKMVNINLYNYGTIFYGFGPINPAVNYGNGSEGYIRQIIVSNTIQNNNSEEMTHVYRSERLVIEAKPVKGYTNVNWNESNFFNDVSYITQLSPAAHGRITNYITGDVDLSDYILEPDELIAIEQPVVTASDTIIASTGTLYSTDLSLAGLEEISATVRNPNNLEVVLYYALKSSSSVVAGEEFSNSVTLTAYANKSLTLNPINEDYIYLHLYYKYGAARSATTVYTIPMHDTDEGFYAGDAKIDSLDWFTGASGDNEPQIVAVVKLASEFYRQNNANYRFKVTSNNTNLVWISYNLPKTDYQEVWLQTYEKSEGSVRVEAQMVYTDSSGKEHTLSDIISLDVELSNHIEIDTGGGYDGDPMHDHDHPIVIDDPGFGGGIGGIGGGAKWNTTGRVGYGAGYGVIQTVLNNNGAASIISGSNISTGVGGIGGATTL